MSQDRQAALRGWRRRATAVALTLLAASGCGGALRLQALHHSAEKPAKIVLLFKVASDEGPVVDLSRDSIRVSEDDRRVDDHEWDLANPDLSERMHVLLLVDLGGRPSAAEKTSVATAAELFLSRLSRRAVVAMYAFDGAPAPHALIPFGAPDSGRARKAIDAFQSKDSSTDLHGAYRAAFESLERQLAAGPLRTGTIVLLARGPDRAARIDLDAVTGRLKESERKVASYAVGVGGGDLAGVLEPFSDGAPAVVSAAIDLAAALAIVAEGISATARSFYLLSYCSAARAGSHELTIEASRTIEVQGSPKTQTGRLSHSFDANGFGAGCDPTIPAEWRKRPTAAPEPPAKPPP